MVVEVEEHPQWTDFIIGIINFYVAVFGMSFICAGDLNDCSSRRVEGAD
jgi:hypothetical protein